MDRACKMHSATMECGDSPSKASAGSSGDGLFFGAGLRPDARLAATAGPSQAWRASADGSACQSADFDACGGAGGAVDSSGAACRAHVALTLAPQPSDASASTVTCVPMQCCSSYVEVDAVGARDQSAAATWQLAAGAQVPSGAERPSAAAAPQQQHSYAQPAPAPAAFGGAVQSRLEAQQQELFAMIRHDLALQLELSARRGFLEGAAPPPGGGESVTPQMRTIVVSWLSEVAAEFNMQQETLFLAVALLDRFMAGTRGVPRSVLQLVAVGCMLLAAKQDEVVHPSVEELTDIAANCFQVQDLLRMERVLLDSLAWRIKTPTAYTFLHLYTQATALLRASPQPLQHPQQQQQRAPMQGGAVAMAAYLTELALLDYVCLGWTPSQIAAAALLLAQSWSEQGAAVAEMEAMAGHTPAELSDCMARLLYLAHAAAGASAAGSSGSGSSGTDALAPLLFVRDKYGQECWLHVSLRPVPATPGAGLGAALGDDRLNNGAAAAAVMATGTATVWA